MIPQSVELVLKFDCPPGQHPAVDLLRALAPGLGPKVVPLARSGRNRKPTKRQVSLVRGSTRDLIAAARNMLLGDDIDPDVMRLATELVSTDGGRHEIHSVALVRPRPMANPIICPEWQAPGALRLERLWAFRSRGLLYACSMILEGTTIAEFRRMPCLETCGPATEDSVGIYRRLDQQALAAEDPVLRLLGCYDVNEAAGLFLAQREQPWIGAMAPAADDRRESQEGIYRLLRQTLFRLDLRTVLPVKVDLGDYIDLDQLARRVQRESQPKLFYRR